MKFLVISKMKDTALTLPPAVSRQLLEISLAAINQQKKEGKIIEYYYSPAGCNVAILDCDNGEGWVKDQSLIPLLSYMNHEVYPLADFNESMNTLLDVLKNAEKMMPVMPH